MNTRMHQIPKQRGSSDTSYLSRTVDQMVWEFMEENKIPGLTLAIVQAPYIPRVVGYGVSDTDQGRLASVNTLWPVCQISQGFAAVAMMQLYEQGKISPDDLIGKYVPTLPFAWRSVTILDLLHHATGIPDYRLRNGWTHEKDWTFESLISLVKDLPLQFEPGTAVAQSATNFLIAAEIIERVSGSSYRDFVTKYQIEFLGLRHTAFSDDLNHYPREDLRKQQNLHKLFKQEKNYIDPAEPAQGYDREGKAVQQFPSSMKGYADIWASAQDISYWDIALAGSVLIHDPKNRAMIYAPWKLPDGTVVPAVSGWQFYHHRGLMDIKGTIPGYSAFLSRFTHAEELVCVTLLANREGIDFTNLARRIAGAFGDLMSTNYDDNALYLYEGQFPVAETVSRLKAALQSRNIPIFAVYDHAKNAAEVDLLLRPTTVVVFGSPKVGTALMQANQSISLELPLRIAVWEDETGSTWLAFPRFINTAEMYDLGGHPTAAKMQPLLEDLVRKAGSIY